MSLRLASVDGFMSFDLGSGSRLPFLLDRVFSNSSHEYVLNRRLFLAFITLRDVVHGLCGDMTKTLSQRPADLASNDLWPFKL